MKFLSALFPLVLAVAIVFFGAKKFSEFQDRQREQRMLREASRGDLVAQQSMEEVARQAAERKALAADKQVWGRSAKPTVRPLNRK